MAARYFEKQVSTVFCKNDVRKVMTKKYFEKQVSTVFRKDDARKIMTVKFLKTRSVISLVYMGRSVYEQV